MIKIMLVYIKFSFDFLGVIIDNVAFKNYFTNELTRLKHSQTQSVLYHILLYS